MVGCWPTEPPWKYSEAEVFCQSPCKTPPTQHMLGLEQDCLLRLDVLHTVHVCICVPYNHIPPQWHASKETALAWPVLLWLRRHEGDLWECFLLQLRRGPYFHRHPLISSGFFDFSGFQSRVRRIVLKIMSIAARAATATDAIFLKFSDFGVSGFAFAFPWNILKTLWQCLHPVKDLACYHSSSLCIFHTKPISLMLSRDFVGTGVCGMRG